MKNEYLEFRYFDTYYLVNVISKIIENPTIYLRGLDDFYGDGKHFHLIKNFNKYSLLHKFIYHVNEELIFESIDDVELDSIVHKGSKLWIEKALNFYQIQFIEFEDYLATQGLEIVDLENEDTIHDYHDCLRNNGQYNTLLNLITEEVFYILFINRELLLKFNKMFSEVMESIDYDEIPNEFLSQYSKKATLKRVHIPKWAQRAIFFRDRAKCCFCNKDLSGTRSVVNRENYDHIVPLAKFGLNDVTNLQLLCKECNQDKKHFFVKTSRLHERWY